MSEFFPDGYAVVTPDGDFVAIYKSRANAEKVAKRNKAGLGETVRPMAFLDGRMIWDDMGADLVDRGAGAGPAPRGDSSGDRR